MHKYKHFLKEKRKLLETMLVFLFRKEIQCHITSVMSNSLRPHGPQPARLFCPWSSPLRITGVGWHVLLQGILPTQGLSLGLLHCTWILYHLSLQGSPCDILADPDGPYDSRNALLYALGLYQELDSLPPSPPRVSVSHPLRHWVPMLNLHVVQCLFI